jgi:hypothetical protein
MAAPVIRLRSYIYKTGCRSRYGVLLGFGAGEGPIGALFTLPLCLGMLIAARRLTAPTV